MKRRAAACCALTLVCWPTLAAVDDDPALGPLLGALAAAETTATPEARWPARAAIARHLRAQDQPALAVYFGKRAVAAIAALRQEPADSVPGALAERLAVYRELADTLAGSGRIDESLHMLRLLKEEEFFDFVQRESAWVDTTAQADLDATESAWDTRWAALPPPSRSRGMLAGTADAAWIAGARAALREMAATVPTSVPPTTARGFLRAAPAASATLRVHAIVAVSHLTLVFETPTWVQARQVVWRRADASQEIGAVLGELASGAAALPQLQALYRQIGAPIVEAARSVGARRIVLLGDDVLRYLPLAALHDGQAHLGEQFTFVHQARPLHSAPRALSARVPVLQAVGVSRSLPGQQALPGVARELCAIVAGPVRGLADVDAACSSDGVVPGEGWLNEEFTARRLSEATARAGRSGGGAMLHVGTHFDLRPGQMARSSLLLGDGSRMALDTIARLDFRGHDLITLSACETGIGGAAGSDGREVEGLNLLLIRRGARAVLASLWRVDDRSTSALMAMFYRKLASHEPAEALRRAQDAVRGNPAWRSPFHWAGFYVTVRP